MATSLTTNNRKMILTSAAVIAVGIGAYGLGRVYPPLGPSAGTVGAAQRYVSSQVGEKDVTLGDTSVSCQSCARRSNSAVVTGSGGSVPAAQQMPFISMRTKAGFSKSAGWPSEV